jgi:hypothetical protein
MRDNHDELDRLLDSALARYADPGPDSGLENRILNRIAAEAVPVRRRRRLAWAIAAPVAAGLLLLAVLAGTRQFRAPLSISPQTSNAGKSAAPDSGGLAQRRAIRSGSSGRDTPGPKGRPGSGLFAARINPCAFKTTGCRGPAKGSSPNAMPHRDGADLEAKSAPLPKLDVFPTPQPLSSQEEALVSFAAKAPERERESLIAAQQEEDAPLSIAAIEIKPLEPPAGGAN